MTEKKKGTPQKGRIVPIDRLRKKKGRPAKAVIAELPDGRQVLLLRPLTGNVKARYERWKKEHEEQSTEEISSEEDELREVGEGKETKDETREKEEEKEEKKEEMAEDDEREEKKHEGTTPVTLPSGKTVDFWDPTLDLKKERKERRRKAKTESKHKPR